MADINDYAKKLLSERNAEYGELNASANKSGTPPKYNPNMKNIRDNMLDLNPDAANAAGMNHRLNQSGDDAILKAAQKLGLSDSEVAEFIDSRSARYFADGVESGVLRGKELEDEALETLDNWSYNNKEMKLEQLQKQAPVSKRGPKPSFSVESLTPPKASSVAEKMTTGLEKSGSPMRIAEELAAGPAEKSIMGAFKRKGAGKMLRNAAVTGGLAIPAMIAMEGLDAESGSSPEELAAEADMAGIAKAERDAVDPASLPLKGNPEMIPYGASQSMKDAHLKNKFEAEGKKHFGQDFSVDVPVDYEDEGTGEKENYTLNMKSKNKLSDKQQMQAAGNDAILGRTGGKIKLPPKSSKSNKIILTEE